MAFSKENIMIGVYLITVLALLFIFIKYYIIPSIRFGKAKRKKYQELERYYNGLKTMNTILDYTIFDNGKEYMIWISLWDSHPVTHIEKITV